EDDSADDEIGMDTKVTLFDEDQQCEDICKIVTTVRSNPLKGLISIESPLGKALLGKKVGDRVLIQVNDSFSYYVQIRAIEKNVGEDDDKIRGY
ncbi:MAG: GreA/GreB family elongation factor, partial [Lachnospiraceae bacterium]|nr:GreA/GreB family elongation factor [Lachnospiraceae bacterium]